MPVTFHIPGALREFTAGHSRVQIERSPKTLAEALSALWTIYPGVRDRIATEQGQVREHINIFIGDENIRYTGGLASPVRSEEHTSELQSHLNLVCRLLLEKKNYDDIASSTG